MWGVCVWADEDVPTHMVTNETGLGQIAHHYYNQYAGIKNGYTNEDQYVDSLAYWNGLRMDKKGNPIICRNQKLKLVNPRTYQKGIENSQEIEEEVVEEIVETPEETSNFQVGMSLGTGEEKQTSSTFSECGDEGDGEGKTSSSVSWIGLLVGLFVGLVCGVLLFYLLYVKKLKLDYEHKKNELSRVKANITSEKSKISSELSQLRSRIKILERDNKRLFDENVSLGVEIDRLRAARFRVNENIEEQTVSLSANQVSSQESGPSMTLYADAIIDDCFVKVRENPNEDSIFVLHLNGDNMADFSIYKLAYQRVVANPSFLEGCEKQILGDTMQLEIKSEGRAQREVSNGKWKVINKLNVIIR